MIGLVGGIQKFSTGDGPGIRTTVFLKGCPLHCQWCHNPEMIEQENELMYSGNRCIACGRCKSVCPQGAISFPEGAFHLDRSKCQRCFRCAEACYCECLHTAAKQMSVQEIIDVVEQDRSYYQRTGGGLTISGGEALFQPAFAEALADEALARGIGVVLDTSGFGDTKTLFSLANKVECILYDLKSIDDAVHRQYTGVSNQLILSHLRSLAADPQLRAKIWIRMPLIAGVNDTPAIIEATHAFLIENQLDLVTIFPYHELGLSKCRSLGQQPQYFEPPSAERLAEIGERFRSTGIETIIND